MTARAVPIQKYLLRTSAVLVVAVGASACSTLPDWVDPTTWVGGDNDQTASSDQSAAQPADSSQTPDLSTIPEKPQIPSTEDEQKQVADSLAADRSHAEYSADALRGGTEPAAAPPSAAPPPSTENLKANDEASEAATAATESAPVAPPPEPTGAPGTLPADNTPAAAPTTQIASAETPPPAAAAPAVAAVPAAPAAGLSEPSDAALGFRPSSAPPLDPTVSQFVPGSILARYRQTAAIAPQPAVPPNVPIASDNNAPSSAGAKKRRKSTADVGGPEAMSGAVVANFDTLQAGTAAAPAAFSGAPAAVVFFPHDTTVLNALAKEQVRAAAQAFLARGGQGFVKVVGHSSSRASNISAARHLISNFERSQARANAVAQALIREGVPADKVLVEAVGDEQPGDLESTPQDEDSNRRAEIFFQG